MSTEFPKSMVCLTEESVEILYALGAQHLISGVSCFVERPAEAKSLPVVTTFTHANLAKIEALAPDLAIGYSDVQKEVARDLTGMGINLFISHHRSLEEIFTYVRFLGRMVGREAQAKTLVADLEHKLDQIRARAKALPQAPRVYLEEWDEPMICGSLWWSQIVEICGGVDVFANKANARRALGRQVVWEEVQIQRPDIILACWCGKKVNVDQIHKRPGNLAQGWVRELSPEIFLQPGIAPIVSGADQLIELFEEWGQRG